jgi:hypothetical protein
VNTALIIGAVVALVAALGAQARARAIAAVELAGAEIGGPAYAIDDQTAIRVTDGAVEVVSEGHWKLFPS